MSTRILCSLACVVMLLALPGCRGPAPAQLVTITKPPGSLGVFQRRITPPLPLLQPPKFEVSLHARADHTDFEATLDGNPAPIAWTWSAADRLFTGVATGGFAPATVSDFPGLSGLHKLRVLVGASPVVAFDILGDTTVFDPPEITLYLVNQISQLATFFPHVCYNSVLRVYTGYPQGSLTSQKVEIGAGQCDQLQFFLVPNLNSAPQVTLRIEIPQNVPGPGPLEVKVQPHNNRIRVGAFGGGATAPFEIAAGATTVDFLIGVATANTGLTLLTVTANGYEQRTIQVNVVP